MEFLAVLASSVLAGIGVYFTHSLRRQQSLKIAEQRLALYRELWELLAVARRTREHPADGEGPLTRQEALDLYREMGRWYYRAGNGLLLSAETLGLYAASRERLGDYAVGEDDETHATRCMRDLSLLRQQMRFDLRTISGRPLYFHRLEPGDKTLLEEAGIRTWPRWGGRYGRLFV